jgi:hypothetical protein
MQSSLDREIRDRLLDYLSGAATLDQLKDWLISVTWDIPEDADKAARELSYEIQLALGDQSSGLTTESELRAALADLITVLR